MDLSITYSLRPKLLSRSLWKQQKALPLTVKKKSSMPRRRALNRIMNGVAVNFLYWKGGG
ncbi:hypothetical protein SAY86_016990 [Trapa natans]|uniref:Uncharacterized protein n=1 Tax=Trapa natans TaxID=22666 RepID=A0AAN7LNJ8_TRANT|nr:hypothetical protein SAY86_016990 [Trapa natans]